MVMENIIGGGNPVTRSIRPLHTDVDGRQMPDFCFGETVGHLQKKLDRKAKVETI